MLALLVALLIATAIGLTLRYRNGRFRTLRTRADAPSPRPEPVLPITGAQATFVQISAEHCAVCPSVARVLGELAAATPGVAHVELRAEENLDLVRHHDVRRSPTVLLVDADGRLVARTSGAMTAAQARAALAHLPTRPDGAATPPRAETSPDRTTSHLEEPVDARA